MARPKFQADMVVHGAGRVADIDELNLPNAGVESEKSGVKVNDYLRVFLTRQSMQRVMLRPAAYQRSRLWLLTKVRLPLLTCLKAITGKSCIFRFRLLCLRYRLWLPWA